METLFFILECDFFLLKTKTIQKKLYSLQLYAVFYYLCIRYPALGNLKAAFIALACGIFALNFRKCEGSANDTT